MPPVAEKASIAGVMRMAAVYGAKRVVMDTKWFDAFKNELDQANLGYSSRTEHSLVRDGVLYTREE